ncbi:MAG TPA: hypothetical protein VLI05_05915 [Candidatus Saccharimonadia bacterium]|nr:hypothetical protein [Candidatus Saccharimonadia bacterium]
MQDERKAKGVVEAEKTDMGVDQAGSENSAGTKLAETLQSITASAEQSGVAAPGVAGPSGELEAGRAALEVAKRQAEQAAEQARQTIKAMGEPEAGSTPKAETSAKMVVNRAERPGPNASMEEREQAIIELIDTLPPRSDPIRADQVEDFFVALDELRTTKWDPAQLERIEDRLRQGGLVAYDMNDKRFGLSNPYVQAGTVIQNARLDAKMPIGYFQETVDSWPKPEPNAGPILPAADRVTQPAAAEQPPADDETAGQIPAPAEAVTVGEEEPEFEPEAADIPRESSDDPAAQEERERARDRRAFEHKLERSRAALERRIQEINAGPVVAPDVRQSAMPPREMTSYDLTPRVSAAPAETQSAAVVNRPKRPSPWRAWLRRWLGGA